MFFPELLEPKRLDPRFSIVTDASELPRWHALLKDCGLRATFERPRLLWDTETSGFRWFKQHGKRAQIIGHAFGYDLDDGVGPRGVYFPMRHLTIDRQLPVEWVNWMVADILGDPRVSATTHNGKFDLLFARADGIDVRARIFDTMGAVQLIDENRPKELEDCAVAFGVDPHAYEMKEAVKKILDEECKRRRCRKRDAPGYAWIPVPILGRYASKDGYNGLALAQKTYPYIAAYWPTLYDTEMRLLRILEKAEWIGTPIDIPYLLDVHRRAEAKADGFEKRLKQLAGFNINVGSDKQIADYVYNHLKYPVTHWTRNKDRPWSDDPADKNPAVDERAIKTAIRSNGPATEFLKTLLLWREQDKITSTYTKPIIEKCDDDGFLHGALKQFGTNTGRLSGEKPNLQNIPTNDAAGIRRAFLVPRGKVRLYLDFSQIELRVLAHYAKEPTMTAAFVNGEDIHTRTSLELFHSKNKEWRRIAKVINFGLSYGMSAYGVMENLNATAKPEEGIDYVTEEQAKEFLDRFHARYPRVMGFCRELWAEMKRHAVPQFTNMFGRVRRLPDLVAIGGLARRAERQAVASEIQGTAADVAKVSMVRVGERLEEARLAGRYDGEFILTIHDENQIDVNYEGAGVAVVELKREMEDFPQFAPIAIVAEAEWSTTNWAEKKPVWEKH